MTNLWKTADESESDADRGRDSDPDRNPWDWGTLRTPSGEIIPPGACEGLHNKDNQQDRL